MSNQQPAILAVSLIRATDLPIADPNLLGGSCDAYVTFVCMDQSKTSPCVQASLNPEWHEESYEFRISKTFEDKTLLVKVWDSDKTSADDLVGIVEIPLRDVPRGRNREPLVNEYPITLENVFQKQCVNSKIYLTIEIWSEEEALQRIRHEVWENERFATMKSWSKDHLGRNERKHWSSENGNASSDSFEAITPTVPLKYKACGTWHYVQAMGDDQGWVYAKNFNGPWYKKSNLFTYVRRRRWINFFEKEADMADNEF